MGADACSVRPVVCGDHEVDVVWRQSAVDCNCSCVLFFVKRVEGSAEEVEEAHTRVLHGVVVFAILVTNLWFYMVLPLH